MCQYCLCRGVGVTVGEFDGDCADRGRTKLTGGGSGSVGLELPVPVRVPELVTLVTASPLHFKRRDCEVIVWLPLWRTSNTIAATDAAQDDALRLRLAAFKINNLSLLGKK